MTQRTGKTLKTKSRRKAPRLSANLLPAGPNPIRCTLNSFTLPAVQSRSLMKNEMPGCATGSGERDFARPAQAPCRSSMMKPSMSRIRKDDVEKLSRGMPTRSRCGSRSIGHRLTQKERILFEAAQRHGFLKLPVSGLRPNVVNIYRLWCEAEGRTCIVVGGPTP